MQRQVGGTGVKSAGFDRVQDDGRVQPPPLDAEEAVVLEVDGGTVLKNTQPENKRCQFVCLFVSLLNV